DSNATEVREMGYDAFPTSDPGITLNDIGISQITNPVHPNGKVFEGWVVYYHVPTVDNFGAASDNGKVYTTAEILQYANTNIGYTDFIAKWQGETIDPNNCVIDPTNNLISSTVPGSTPGVGGTGFDVLVETGGVPFMHSTPDEPNGGEIGEAFHTSVPANASLNNAGISIWHEPQHEYAFLDWRAFKIDANGNEIDEGVIDTKQLNEMQFDSAYRFVAEWEFYNVRIETGVGTFDCSINDNGTTRTQNDIAGIDYSVMYYNTLTDYGFQISGIPDELAVAAGETFYGWDLFRLDPAMDEDGNPLTDENGDPLMNETFIDGPMPTEEMLMASLGADVVFRANWTGPQSGEGDGELIVPANHNLIIDSNNGCGVKLTFKDGTTEIYHGFISDDLRSSAQVINTLADLDIASVELLCDEEFVGWSVYEPVFNAEGNVDTWDPIVNDDGEPLWLLNVNDILTYPLGNGVRFCAEWNAGGNQPEGPEPDAHVAIQGNYGTFEITQEDGTVEKHTDYGFPVFEGECLADYGFKNISNPVYWDPDRAFVGWEVCTLHTIVGEDGEERGEFLPLDGVLLKTTQELMNYKFPAGGVLFRAQYAGSDEDYITEIGFYGFGGEFTVKTYDGEGNVDEQLTTADWGFPCLEDGTTPKKQYPNVEISNPILKGYTFEGWLAYTLGTEQYDIPDKLYTTKEVLSGKVPEDTTIFVAKWKEISIDEYRYADWDYILSDDPYRFILNGNGGDVAAVETVEGKNEDFGAPVYGYETYGKQTFAESNKNNGYDIVSITAEKDLATFEGWTTYTAEKSYIVELEKGVTPNITDPSIIVIYAGVVEDVDEYGNMQQTDMYVMMKNVKVLSETLTPEEVMKYSAANYYMVANWADWVEVKVEGSNEKYMLDVNTTELSVPAAAAKKYATVADVKKALEETAKGAPKVNKDKVKTVFYEITLKMQKEDGTWEVVTAENFPKNGVKITIPYNGLDPKKLDFVVTHLISSGDKAGEIEILNHTEGNDGLEAVVYSLSPFAVSYQNEEDAVAEPTTEPTATPAPTEKPESDVPPTGDDNALWYWSFAMILAAAGIFMTAVKVLGRKSYER
ncbi:MAG: hypothetical protein II230_04015, partial [Clostridia bacterium]|nr:hypothetical protein [Clostridia bacterium]